MNLPKSVQLVEVGPRDGLQNEPQPVATGDKITLIQKLVDSGLSVIEAGSFVSSKWVPQMADSAQVLAALPNSSVRYPVLTPNIKGLERAMAAGAREVAVFAAASESFSQRNINCSIDQSLEKFAAVIDMARKHELRIRGYVSCVLGCPYEGDIPPRVVARVAGTLLQMGCDEISLGDTIGVGTPNKARQMIDTVGETVPLSQLAVHFHDTYGQALANIYAVLQQGIHIVDCSVAGLGGCPYAPGASGNVATEDVLYLLQGLGIDTGVSLPDVAKAGRFICNTLGKVNGSRTAQALLGKNHD